MNDQLSVVHVTNTLGLGGTQKAMEVFVRNLPETGFEVSICGYKKSGTRGEELSRDGYAVDLPNSRSNLTDILNKREADIVHIHGMYDTAAEVADVAKRAGVPVLIKSTPFGRVTEGTQRNIDLHLFPSKMTLLRKLKLEGRDIQAENWDRSLRMQYYPLSKSDISDRHRGNLRGELGIDADTPIVGKIGRSSAAKWSEVSIDAFERICRDRPQVKILLVTPPEKIKTAISRRGLNPYIVYLDSIPPSEVGKFYNTIDVLAHSSAIGESFGYVIAEAMAYSTPVVVDSNPMRDNAQVELVNNGETGFVVGSSETYADAVAELLQSDELRRGYGAAAQRRATTLLDPTQIIEELVTIYRVLYESNGDTDALTDALGSQRDMMVDFESEYRRRLHDLYGSKAAKHRLERGVWRFCSDFLPAYRNEAYHHLQGLFKNI